MANNIDFNVSTNAVTVLNQTAGAAENTAKGFTSAKAELRALNNQLLEMDQTSDAFKKASARAAELKDNISDLGAEINANAGNAFEGLSNNVGLFSSRLMDLDLKGAGQALSGMGAAVGKIDFKTVKEEVGGLIKGLANLGKAILANPILLLGAIIAGIIVNWKEFAALFKGETAVLNSLKKELGALEAQNAAIKNKITYAKMYGDSLYSQYVLSQQLLQNEIKQEQTKKRIAEIQDESEASEEARKKIIELQNKALLEQNQHITDYYNVIDKANLVGNDAAKIENEKRKATEEYNSALEETRAKLIQLRSDRKLSLSGVGNAFDIQVYEDNERKLLDAIDKTNKTIDKRESDARKERKQKEIDDYNKSQEEIDAIFQKWDEERIAEEQKSAQLKYDLQQKELARAEEQFQQLQRLQSTAKENEINDAVLASEKLQELAVGNLDLETATQEELKAKIAEINKKYADEEQALRDKKTDDIKKKDADERKLALDTANARLEIAQQGFTALSALGDAYFSSQLANVQAGSKAELDLKKKQFAFNKKMQIGGAIMDTAKAITAAIAANPFPSPTLPVSIALASITGAAQIAKIASTKFDGGGGGGGGGVNIPTGGDGTTAPSPANYDFISQQPNQQPPLQAYVVGTQVSSNLEAQQLIQNQSRLGG
jgi:hypothetical protein